MSQVVQVRGLTKTYGNFKAVDAVDFTLEEGRIYGLLGRNGAGKTTIMHLLTAQLFPTEGELLVFGEKPYENNRVLSRICFIKESQKYPDGFRVEDVLATAAIFYPNWDASFAARLVEDFRLPLKRKIKKLSRGMLSAVGIIVGLASRAPVTLFDEPYLGLDASARTLFYDHLMQDFADYPRTVILSTHLIDEVSGMLEHVIVIDKGRIILDEEADALRGRAYSVAGTLAKVEQYTANRHTIHKGHFGSLATATILDQLDAESRQEAESLNLEIGSVSLQQMFVHLTGEQLPGKAATGQ